MTTENDDLPGDETATPAPEPAAIEKPEPKKAPEAKPPEPRKVHTHTDRLRRIALGMGFSEADLDNHDSATIWEEVHRLQSLATEREKAKAPAKKEPEVDEDEEFIKELEASDTDPKYIAFLKRQHARTKAAEAKAAKVDDLEARDKKRHEQALQDAADAAFASLAKDPKAALLIGTGLTHELDPGEFGWRRAIWQAAKVDEANDTPAVLQRKLVTAGKAMLAKKLGGGDPAPQPPASPPPPAAPKKTPPRDPQNGRFTEEDYAKAKLPVPGNRLLESSPELTGAAVIHAHMREVGDARASLEYVDRDEADDLP